MFKVNNKDTRTTSKRRSGIFIITFDHISHIFSGVSIIDFEQEKICWLDLSGT